MDLVLLPVSESLNAPSSSTVTESNYTLQPTSYDGMFALVPISYPQSPPSLGFFTASNKHIPFVNRIRQKQISAYLQVQVSNKWTQVAWWKSWQSRSSNQGQRHGHRDHFLDGSRQVNRCNPSISRSDHGSAGRQFSQVWEDSQHMGNWIISSPFSTSLSVESSTIPIETRFNAMGTLFGNGNKYRHSSICTNAAVPMCPTVIAKPNRSTGSSRRTRRRI